MFQSKKSKSFLKLVGLGCCIILFFTSIFYSFDHTHFNGIDEEHETDKFIHRLYFTISTLSSGYGDITPKSIEVKMISILLQSILIIGLMSGIINLLE